MPLLDIIVSPCIPFLCLFFLLLVNFLITHIKKQRNAPANGRRKIPVKKLRRYRQCLPWLRRIKTVFVLLFTVNLAWNTFTIAQGAISLYRSVSVLNEKRNYIYSAHNHMRTLNEAFFNDDTPSPHEKAETAERLYYEKLHFDLAQNSSICRNDIFSIISSMEPLYYKNPVKENTPWDTLTPEDQVSVRSLAKEIRSYQRAPLVSPQDIRNARDTCRESYDILPRSDLIFQSAVFAENFFWSLAKTSWEEAELLEAAACAVDDFDEFLLFRNRSILLNESQMTTIYQEDVLFRQGKILFYNGFSDTKYEKEALLISYALMWFVSENAEYYSTDICNARQALGYAYRAQLCERMLALADSAFSLSLCREGIACCTRAEELWQQGGYLEEGATRKNTQTLKENLETRLKQKEKIRQSTE